MLFKDSVFHCHYSVMSEAKDGYNNRCYCYLKQRFETEQKSFINVSLERNHKLVVK